MFIRRVIISIILVIACCVSMLDTTAWQAYASSNVIDFDGTYVLDDLAETKIDNADFNIDDYGVNVEGDLKVLTLAEFGYSYYTSKMSNYSIYVYVYNPAWLDIHETSVLNTIQLATKFDSSLNAVEYNKFRLKFLSVSQSPHSRLFYKFKLLDTQETLLSIMEEYARNSGGIRKYIVGEIELLTRGDNNATAYKVGKQFEYSGFAEGFGANSGTSLGLTISVQETLSLQVYPTFYRPNGSNGSGAYVQDQLNSVYFAVPNRMLRAYGELYAAHVEWYEYLTKEILVMKTHGSNEFSDKVYNKFLEYLGVEISSYNSDLKYGFASNLSGGSTMLSADKKYNTDFGFLGGNERVTDLCILFASNGLSLDDFIITGDDLLQYMKDYSAKENNYDVLGKYSSNLFYEELAEGRTRYNNVNIKSTDNMVLESHVLDDKWWNFFGNFTYKESIYRDIEGIKKLTGEDVFGSDKNVSKKLYVDENDVSHLREFVTISTMLDRTVFILRYAVTDYESTPARIIEQKGSSAMTLETYSIDTYLAQQTVFLNFDIIDITFHKDGSYTVIPVVASPMDIVADVTPPIEKIGCLEEFVESARLIFIVLLIVLLAPLLLKIVYLIFRLLGAIIRLFAIVFKLNKRE